MAIRINSDNEGYFNGIKVELTGRSDPKTYSFTMVELRFIDGQFAGKTFWLPESAVKKTGDIV